MKKYILFLFFFTISNTYSQEIIDPEKIFNSTEVDKKPEYKGGMEKFYNYIGKRFRVPDVQNLKGKIIVEFIIEKDGELTNFKVIQDIGYGSAEEISKAFKDCPKWKPGIKDGQIVRTLFNFPISIISGS